MARQLRLLIVEDSLDDTILLMRELQRNGYEPDFERVETRESMKEALGRREWDIVISDYVMPRFSGFDALTVLKESGLDLPFIIVSGNIGEDIAVEAMRAGAHDYMVKGSLARLAPAVERELRDVEVRRARRRIEEERLRLSAAVESAVDAVVITDSRGAIQYVNPMFETITGYTKDEVTGRNIHILDSGKDGESFYRDLREKLRRDGVWTGRLLNKKKDGSLYYEDCTYSTIKGSAGEIVNYVSIRRDVTENLRLESIAEAVDTMNNIGYIFSGVRHEIVNPVNAMVMTLGILQSNLDLMPREKIREYVDRMMSYVSRIEYLLKSLKSFNMYENLNIESLYVPSFMENFLALVSEDFAKKGIEIKTAVDSKAEKVHADPRALQQVLTNLITNASDALHGRKDPRITIEVSGIATVGMVRIRVEDNGHGMAEDKLKDLFKAFHTTKEHGTGLGLVIVKKLLAKMNGTVEIMSRPGEGMRVDMFLPAGK
jgi:PAS domain S-box-containing protein